MSSDYSNKELFTKRLLVWYNPIDRPMPWKGEKNPYLIWLSEVILQQTRVEQGLPYFEKFKTKYPTISDLANAPQDEIMKMWEGLGYYSRARNLHAAAQHVAHKLAGKFPKSYEGIRELKGVGPYTAAAIASFAFDLPHAVVDGNVYRVLSRYFGIDLPVDATEGKKFFTQLAQELLDKDSPGKYNQAIMDFGATQCTPALPSCSNCPMQQECKAFQANELDKFPVKVKKLKRTQRFFNYLIIKWQDQVFIRKRTEKDIWQNLYEFPLIETDILVEDRQIILEHESIQQWKVSDQITLTSVSPPSKQDLTHQRIIARFWKLEIDCNHLPQSSDWLLISSEKIGDYAFPKVIAAYLREKLLTLELF